VGDGRVAGVRGVDCRHGRAFEFRTDVVINAAGPWCREVALRFHTDIPHLFRSMLAWNVLFDRPAISTHGLAVSPPGPGGHTYFIVPWKGMLLAGTGQSPWQPEEKEPRVDERQLTHFCQDLNRAMPSLALRRDEIVHVFAGLQSATRPGGEEFTKRHLIVDHSRLKGPQGLFSISGIKFTTARKVAEETLNSVFPQKRHAFNGQEDSFYTPYRDFADQRVLLGRDWQPHTGNGTWRQVLQKVIVEEAVRHLDDLIIRRTDLGDHPVRAIELAGRLSDLFAWCHADRIREMERLRAHFSYLQAPAVGTREESTLQAQGY
jgi:glycerol-3-phosphate dehydrogenase